MVYPQRIQNLVRKFSEFPTIGPKTAERIILYLISQDEQYLSELAQAIDGIRGKIMRCENCNNFSEHSPCSICSDKRRDQKILCIVEKPQDIEALEKPASTAGYTLF